MARDDYTAQVDLLVRILPIVADEPAFALKGGTAINLFYRDMPRLSVDIDLVYVPIDERAAALAAIDAAFDRIGERSRAMLRGVEAQRAAGGGNGDTRLLVKDAKAEVKVEVSPVMRGTVAPTVSMRVRDGVEDAFGFAETNVVAFEDLFAGKMCAALDRQHPRDLYDIALLYEQEGLTDALFRTFLVYLVCSGRPLHEMIDPNRLEIDRAFAQEFDGMTVDHVPLDALLAARDRLIADVHARTVGPSAEFLLTVHDGAPRFDLIGLPAAADLPAVRWKLLNLDRLRKSNPGKFAVQRAALEMAIAKD